jgi:hypothetical protein
MLLTTALPNNTYNINYNWCSSMQHEKKSSKQNERDWYLCFSKRHELPELFQTSKQQHERGNTVALQGSVTSVLLSNMKEVQLVLFQATKKKVFQANEVLPVLVLFQAT